MDKVFDYLFPAVGVSLLIVAIGGYYYLSATPSFANKAESTVSEDVSYLSSNEEKYADCYHTVKSNSDFSVATVTNRLYNQGVSKEKLELIESQFKVKYEKECTAVLKTYEDRYNLYVQHRKEAAEYRLSKLDKIMGKKAEVASRPSPIFSLYQEYEPKSLQYPTNTQAKMLYTASDYEIYVQQNL